MASTKQVEQTAAVETGLRFRRSADEGGAWVVTHTSGTTPRELRLKADELNEHRPDAEASAVFRHVLYDEWQPITHVSASPNPAAPGTTVYQVS